MLTGWAAAQIRKCDANKPVIKAGQKHGTLLIVLSGAVKIVPGPVRRLCVCVCVCFRDFGFVSFRV